MRTPPRDPKTGKFRKRRSAGRRHNPPGHKKRRRRGSVRRHARRHRRHNPPGIMTGIPGRVMEMTASGAGQILGEDGLKAVKNALPARIGEKLPTTGAFAALVKILAALGVEYGGSRLIGTRIARSVATGMGGNAVLDLWREYVRPALVERGWLPVGAYLPATMAAYLPGPRPILPAPVIGQMALTDELDLPALAGPGDLPERLDPSRRLNALHRLH